MINTSFYVFIIHTFLCVYQIGYTPNNKINIGNINTVIFTNNGSININNNNITSGTTTYSVYSSSTTTSFITNNIFKLPSGGVWNRGATNKVWWNNKGYKTIVFGMTSLVNGGTVAHGLSNGSPPVIIANVRDSKSYIVNATNITFSIYNS